MFPTPLPSSVGPNMQEKTSFANMNDIDREQSQLLGIQKSR